MESKPAITPRLVIIEGKDKGKVLFLKDGSLVIGRSKGDVVIQDPRVSRSHVAIHYDEKTGKVTFADLKSLNGTQINGEAQPSGELKDGDKLLLGNTLLDCQIGVVPEMTSTNGPKALEPGPAAEPEREPPPSVTFPPEPRFTPEEVEEPKPSISMATEPKPEPPPVVSAPAPVSVSTPTRAKPAAKLPLGAFARAAAVLVILMGVYSVFFSKSGESPQNKEKLFASVKALATQGKLEEALAKAETLRDLFPENSDVYMLLGNLHAQQKRYELAIGSFRKAHEFEPPQPLVHTRLIQILLRAGLQKEAQEELTHIDQLIREGHHSKELFVETAKLFLEFQELQQPAEKTFILAKALQTELAPDSTVGYKLDAQLRFQQNRPEEALATLEKGLKIDPSDEWLLENMAFAKLSLRDISGAMESVESWIRLYPNATKPLLVMAHLKFNTKDIEGAQNYAQRILAVAAARPAGTDPYYPEALDLLGQIYTQRNETEQAAQYFKQACGAGFQQACNRDRQAAEAK